MNIWDLLEDLEPIEEFARLMHTTKQDEKIKSTAKRYLQCCIKQNKFRSLKTAQKLFDIYERYFRRKHFKDGDLVLPLIRAACVHNKIKRYVVQKFLLWLLKPDLENLLEVAKRGRFDFWGLWSSSDQPSGSLAARCPVTQALFQPRVDHLKVLVDHGFQKKKGRQFTKEHLFGLLKSRGDYDGTWRQFSTTVKNMSDRAFLVLETFFYFYRIVLQLYIGSITCMVIVWRGLPYPHITPDEMFEVMEGVLSSDMNPLLITVCESYTGCFPDAASGMPSPRTLRHLSRCAIRGALTEAWRMPEGIGKLDVPMELKEYIRLEK